MCISFEFPARHTHADSGIGFHGSSDSRGVAFYVLETVDAKLAAVMYSFRAAEGADLLRK